MSSGEGAEDGMLAPACVVLYQSVELDVDMVGETIEGTTWLWVLYKEAPPIGSMLALHNRTKVHQVHVNGIACPFDARDPLESIYYDADRKQNFLGPEADINYRAALELTREGELRIEVPDLALSAQASLDPTNSFEFLPPLPNNARSELTERFTKMDEALEMVKKEIRLKEKEKHEKRLQAAKMKAEGAAFGETKESSSDIEPAIEKNPVDSGDEIDDGVRSRLLQVRIAYSVPKANEVTSRGVVFRQSASSRLAATSSADDGGVWTAVDVNFKQPKKDHSANSASASEVPEKPEGATCLYTTGAGGEGGLRDLDGVRCWLPCIDSPEQRPIFDVTIKTQSSFQVLCSGIKVSSTVLQTPQSSMQSLMEVSSLRRVESYLGASAHAYSQDHSMGTGSRCATRFVTPVRIAAMSLGFFVGNVEVYKVPLYKVAGRAWVALGLGDLVFGNVTSSQQQLDQDVGAGDDDEGNPSSFESGMSRGILRVGRSESVDSSEGSHFRDKKRPRLQEVGSSVGAAAIKPDSPNSPTRARPRAQSFGAPVAPPGQREHAGSIDEAEAGRQARLRSMHVPMLYEALVRHSALGLDMSLRLLHKFVGHAYDHEIYTQVYIDGLGDSFLAYDGFSLIDSRILHSEEQGYLESSAHLLHLRSYLYSWLMTAMPLDSYESSFVVHGAVGYLQNVFVEQVYGEEDGVYRMQKHIDTSIDLEKLGWGFPLTSSHPESSDILTSQYRQYVSSKSTVLYHLLEMHIGGRDSMRLALKALVKSPSLYDKEEKGAAGKGGVSEDGNLMRTSSIDDNEDGALGSPVHSPMRLRAMQTAEAYGLITPHPYLALAGPQLTHQRSRTVLRRLTGSINETGWGWVEEPFALHANAISVESFFSDLRNCAGAIIDLPDDFVSSLIHSSGAHILHTRCDIEAQVEGRQRNFNVRVASVSCARGKVDKGVGGLTPMEIKFNVVEALSEQSADFVILTNDHQPDIGSHQHQLQTRTNRQRIRKRKGMAKPSQAQEMEMLERMSRERLRSRKQREHLMDSLEMAREMEHPIKLLCPHPNTAALYEVHLQLPDPLLVELLFSEHDALDSLRHLLALRSLGRMSPLGNVSNSVEFATAHTIYDQQHAWSEQKGPPHSSRLQLRALSDCLNGSCPSASRDTNCVAGPHHINVRCEAAYALAAWQNLRSPRSTIAENNLNAADAAEEIDPWAALAILLAVLRDTCMEHGHATPLDLSSETACRMRYSLLLAISTVRSLGGYTPQSAIDALLHFADACDEVPAEPTVRTGPFSAKRERFSRVRSKNVVMDNSQYKGVLLLALGNVKPEPRQGRVHFEVMSKIREFALQCLQNDWTAARTSARIAARPDEPSRLPLLAMSGAITALGLHCLVELDMHFLFLDSLRGALEPPISTSGAGIFGSGGSKSGLGHGPYTGVNYPAYFLPVGTRIGGISVPSGSEGGVMSERFFATSPGVVRAAGLEATVRLLFAQQTLSWDRALFLQDPNVQSVEKRRIEELLCIPTALAAVMTVLHNESSRWVRRQAALTLQGAVLDRPGRTGPLALGMGEAGACLSWSDAEALSLSPTKVCFLLREMKSNRLLVDYLTGSSKVLFTH